MDMSTLAVIWQPMISPQRIVGIAVILAALAIVVYARSMRQTRRLSIALLAMRLIVIGAIATLLMGPSAAPPPLPKAVRPRLHVLVDTSQSMLTKDMAQRSRISAVQEAWLTPERVEELSQVSRPDFYEFDDTLRAALIDKLRGDEQAVAAGRATHLAQSVRQCVEQSYGESEGVAILVISDGRDSADAPMGRLGLLARARGIPIHTVCVGGPTMQKDMVVSVSPGQRYLLAGSEGYIRVRVDQQGMDAAIAGLVQQGQPLQVHMECDGVTQSAPLDFNGQGLATVDLAISQDTAGEYSYKVWVDPLADDFEPANNTQHAFVEVVEERVRALLLEGEPFWETKFAARALRKDPRVDLTFISYVSADKQVVILNDPSDVEVKAPASLEDLCAYDVVILGRGLERLLPAEVRAALVEYVGDRGGNLVFARGQAYDTTTAIGRQASRDMAVLEPVVWGREPLHGLALAPTLAGRRGVFFDVWDDQADQDSMPTFTVMPAVDRVKTGAVVLARAVAPGRGTMDPDASAPPAMVRMEYGSGVVLAVLGEGLWRWGLGDAAEDEKTGTPYEQLWCSMVGWLVMGSDFRPGEEVALLLGGADMPLGKPVLIGAACKTPREDGFSAMVRVTSPDGVEAAVAMSPSPGSVTRVQGQFTPDQPGVYVINMTTEGEAPVELVKRFNVTNASLERLRASADPAALARLAEESGGLVFQFDQAGKFPGELAAIFAGGRETGGPRHVWDKWHVLVVLLAWAGCEWIFRKRAGLL